MEDKKKIEDLASELGGELGKENGPEFLKMARASMFLSASKTGTKTSEWMMSIVLLIASLGMIGFGYYSADPVLTQHGVSMAQVVTAGYAASRGMAKLGAGLGSK